MTKLYPPRLPVAPAEPGHVKEEAAPPANDAYRQLIIDNERLSLMHLRIYDHWRRRTVSAPAAYALALAAFSDNAAYLALRRRVTNRALS